MKKKPSYNHTRGDSPLTPCAKCAPRKKSRVMVVELAKMPIPTDPAGTIAALESMRLSPGWQIVERDLDENIAYLTRAVLEKADPLTGNEIDDAEADRLRYRLKLTQAVRDTPLRIIGKLSVTDEEDDRDDPYETADDVRKARS